MIAVLGIAVGGWFVDRVLIGYDLTSPNEAAAQYIGESTLEPAMPEVRTTANKGQPVAQLIADRLRAVSDDAGPTPIPIRNAFHPVASWSDQPEPTRFIESTVDVKAFAQAHRLEAILVIDGRNYAILDGQEVMSVGQSLDGFELMSMDEQSAVFSLSGVQIELTLE